jgi:hypothetical protein
MTTIKRNWGIIGILFIAALLLMPATQAEAKTVKDVEGHSVNLYERRGVVIFENGETAAYHTCGTSDYIKGQGSFHGYSDILYKDGSRQIWEDTGSTKLAPGEKQRIMKGEGKYIKGTGRFEGIQGSTSFTGKSVTPYTKDTTKGDAVFDGTATYTMPKK